MPTVSEKEGPSGLLLKREVKVHDCVVNDGYGADGKHKVKIWEDVVQAHGALGQPPVMTDNVIVVRTLLALLTQPTGFLLISFDVKLEGWSRNNTLLSISWIF
jgi:hypothetical protein